MDSAEAMSIGRDAIVRILGNFPRLRSTEDRNVPVEISVTLPVQDGLKHEVWLALQNSDELTFGVNHFQCEWFPCTDKSRVEEFVEAVVGWLSGRHRILEHYRGSRCVKAELQVPQKDDWKTLATWSSLWIPYPRRKTFRALTKDGSSKVNDR